MIKNIIGSQDGSINFWERESGKHVAKLHCHNEPSSVVLFNPRYLMFASADVNLVSIYSEIYQNVCK